MLYWSDLKALWALLEKYQQYLTISIEDAKDLVAMRTRDVCPFQRADNSYKEWDLYYSLHKLVQGTQEDAAYAIKMDAVTLISETCAAKLRHVEASKIPLYENFWYPDSPSPCRSHLPEDPGVLLKFEAKYDSLTRLWDWASKKLGYNIHASRWPEVISKDLKEPGIRAKILRYLRDCAKKGKADEFAPANPSGEAM